MKPPIPLEEAQARLLALAETLEVENVAVGEAANRYLAEPLIARITKPTADLSAMDGYAVSGPTPWQVIGESKCGAPFHGTITRSQAVRISTGAIMPAGSDRVLLQEDALREGPDIALQSDMPPAGHHIRRKGFDFTEGDLLLQSGTRIDAAQIALIRASGSKTVQVRRKPSLTIIESGDELAADPENCGAHQIPASNGAMLAAMAGEIPCYIKCLDPIPDRLYAIEKAFRQSEDSDLIVTSGGASVGDHDLIRPALEAWGADIDFWRVAIKPGKPLLVARRGKQIILGLPGNPVSSFATAFLFLLPLLRHMAGAMAPLPRRSISRAATDMPATGPRREFIRGIDDGTYVTPISEQDSSALRALASANAFIERPENSAETKAGTDVPVYLLQNG